MGAIASLGHWVWIIGGLILLALEVTLPGNVLIWFGIAAIVTGGIAFVTDFGWQIDLLIFAALCVVLVVVGRRYFAPGRAPSEQPFLNQRAQRHVGSMHVLTEPIVDGQGRIRIDDTNWRVIGPDLPSGTRVRVETADGAVLKVAKAG